MKIRNLQSGCPSVSGWSRRMSPVLMGEIGPEGLYLSLTPRLPDLSNLHKPTRWEQTAKELDGELRRWGFLAVKSGAASAWVFLYKWVNVDVSM